MDSLGQCLLFPGRCLFISKYLGKKINGGGGGSERVWGGVRKCHLNQQVKVTITHDNSGTSSHHVSSYTAFVQALLQNAV